MPMAKKVTMEAANPHLLRIATLGEGAGARDGGRMEGAGDGVGEGLGLACGVCLGETGDGEGAW